MANESSTLRLIIISVPPHDTAVAICRFMERLAAVGGGRRALEYPPHVTLRTGAVVPEGELPSYVNGFREHLADQDPVEIATSGFTHLVYQDESSASRHFFGYNVVLSTELQALHQQLCGYRDYIKGEPRDYWPHLSIAYHDVDSTGAERIEGYLEGNPDVVPSGFSWSCDRVSLYWRDETTGGAGTPWTEAASIIL